MLFFSYQQLCHMAGIVAVLGLAVLFSYNRKQISYSLVCKALLMQFFIGWSVLKTTVGKNVIAAIAQGVGKLYLFAGNGASFLFGSLATNRVPWGVVFGIQILPLIIFFGAFMAILFHFGIVQRCVWVIGSFVRPILGSSGPETLCAISNSFLGQTEAPLLIRDYLKNMTKSEMLVVMVSGMGTISGSILVAYASMGVPAEHLLAASVMAIPSTILIAKILAPETSKKKKQETLEISHVASTTNVFDAISQGTIDGLHLTLNVGAMLIAFVALIAMANGTLSALSLYINELFGLHLPEITLSYIFSKLFLPFGYFLGARGEEAGKVAELLGTKVVVNEFLAYSKLANMHLSAKTTALVTYALCGFSNFSCIGIQVGGIGALVPEKRNLLTELGLRAVLGGTLANLLSALMAGLVL